MMEEKTYLIAHKDGTERQITVPADWKVTFGPAARGQNNGKYPTNKMPLALRFYENEKQQRAIFTDVVSFRDMSIKIKVKKISTQEKDGFMECEGVRKSTVFRAQTSEWVDPDEGGMDLPALIGKGNAFEVEFAEDKE